MWALILDSRDSSNSSLLFEVTYLSLFLQRTFMWRVGKRVKVDVYSQFLRDP